MGVTVYIIIIMTTHIIWVLVDVHHSGAVRGEGNSVHCGLAAEQHPHTPRHLRGHGTPLVRGWHT